MRLALFGLFLAALPLLAEEFPAADLRGFGRVSGSLAQSSIDSQPGSVLTITCEDADHAKLVLAKFLSDAQCLPGTTPQAVKIGQWGMGSLRFGGTPLNALQVEGQGWLAAARVGAKVLIASSPTPETLVKQFDAALAGTPGTPVSEAEVKVPMWLDRWDKHGFRFYYSPWATPPGQDRDTYDYRGDSTFAKDSGVGMVFWENLSHVLGADQQTDRTFWDWDEKWAAQDGVPSAINLSALNYDIPPWLSNRYRDWMMQPMPGYLGDSMDPAGWRGTAGKTGELAYGDTPALDAELSAVQQDVRHFASHPNVVSWLEPHGELAQGGDDLMGYGPACDKTFRAYLEKQYPAPGAVATAWGTPGAFANWNAIHCPELADFAGWGPDALDLAGAAGAGLRRRVPRHRLHERRLGRPAAVAHARIGSALFGRAGQPAAWKMNSFKTPELSPDWFTPTFNDSAWLAVTAPGDDRNFTLPKQPAVYRRTIDLPADWTAKHPRSWVYLWDISMQHTDIPVQIWINGKEAGQSPVQPPSLHWMSAEVTSQLQPGTNQVSLVLPDGYIGYRVYLSGVEPKQYPDLGAGLNQEWVDLVGWRQAVRVDSVRRGMEMVREVDPNRGITLMAPGYAADGVKTYSRKK
jgi:hypothetical protein